MGSCRTRSSFGSGCRGRLDLLYRPAQLQCSDAIDGGTDPVSEYGSDRQSAIKINETNAAVLTEDNVRLIVATIFGDTMHAKRSEEWIQSCSR